MSERAWKESERQVEEAWTRSMGERKERMRERSSEGMVVRYDLVEGIASVYISTNIMVM